MSTSLSTASGGDSTCLMWDLRKERPVARVYSQEQVTKGNTWGLMGVHGRWPSGGVGIYIRFPQEFPHSL